MADLTDRVARAHCWELNAESEGRCGYESCRNAGRCMDEFSTAERAAARAAISAVLDALAEPSDEMFMAAKMDAIDKGITSTSSGMMLADWRAMLAAARRKMLP